MKEKTLDWYLERLPEKIEFNWVAQYPGPYNNDEGPDDRVRWSKNKYTYYLKIFKRDGKWVAHYELPGYEGETVCTMPECDIMAERMIKENDPWIRYDCEDLIAKENFREVIINLWEWLGSRNLIDKIDI